jgi:hypothetical protein
MPTLQASVEPEHNLPNFRRFGPGVAHPWPARLGRETDMINLLILLVELMRFELTTSAVRLQRSPI